MTRRTLTALAASIFCAFALAWAYLPVVAEPIPETGGGPTTESAPTPQDRALLPARTKFANRDFEGALKLLKEAAKKDPDLRTPQIQMAMWSSEVQDAYNLRYWLEQAVVEAPEDPEAYILMGYLATREQRFTEAKMLYDKATELMAQYNHSPKLKEEFQAKLYSGLASIAQARQNWPEAQKQLEAWLKMDPSKPNFEGLQRLAFCLFQQKDVEGSRARLTEARKIKGDLRPEVVLSEWYTRTNDRDNAKKWMANAIAAWPKDSSVQVAAGLQAFMLGNLKEAAQHAAAARELEPTSLDAKNLLGVIALFEKNFKQAETYFRSMVTQAGKSHFRATNNLALALVEQSDSAKKQEAMKLAKDNLEAHSRDENTAEACSTYGWTLYKNNRMEEAGNFLARALNAGAMHPETDYYLARVLADRGRDQDLMIARQLLDRALKSQQPFSYRQDATDLSATLNAKLKK